MLHVFITRMNDSGFRCGETVAHLFSNKVSGNALIFLADHHQGQQKGVNEKSGSFSFETLEATGGLT